MKVAIALFVAAAAALPAAAWAQTKLDTPIRPSECIAAQNLQSGNARLRNLCNRALNVAWCVRGGGSSSQRCPTGGSAAALKPRESVSVRWSGAGTLMWGGCFAPHSPYRYTGAAKFECR